MLFGRLYLFSIGIPIQRRMKIVQLGPISLDIGAISVTPNPADFGGKRDQAAKHPGYVVYVAYRQVA